MPGADVRRGMQPATACARLLVLLGVFTASYWIAFAVRDDFTIPSNEAALLRATLPWVLGIKICVTYLLQGFHGWVRYVSFYDLMQLARSVAAAAIGVILVNSIYFNGAIPTGVLFLDPLFTFLFVGCLRSTGRFFSEQFWPLVNAHLLKRHEFRRVLLVGANRTGAVLANQVNFHPKLHYRVVGYLDDDAGLHGTNLAGTPVLCGLGEAAAAARSSSAEQVLVLAGSIPGASLRQLMTNCEKAGVSVKIITNVYDLVNTAPSSNRQALRLREVDINDLLHREPVALDDAALGTFLEGRVVLVTGAGGSIGSEICRQVLRFKPRALVLVERAENNLFQVACELRVLCGATAIHACVADVTDQQRLRQVFDEHVPEVLFHAAAHKHVALMESNPGEAIKNNVLGSRLVADLAHEYGVKSFVFISTDKAVRPVSVMGLTKQVAERYVHAMSEISETRFVAVRFGNVLGSSGSVVPIFQEQIRMGGPVTVTHPDMRRYFMTIPEASRLVLQAGAMGQGGEIFVLDMGEPVRIVDLALDLIRLSDLSPDDIEIVYTGPGEGEKLNEELYLDEEQTLPTPHPKVRVARHKPFSLEKVARLIVRLGELADATDAAAIKDGLRQQCPEFGRAAPAPLPAGAKQPRHREFDPISAAEACPSASDGK